MAALDLSSLRIMIVDDNAHMRRIVRMLLQAYSARDILEAADGAEALEQFNNQLPDLVITDWSMPVFDGIELTRMLRNTDSSPNPYVPIIMMTGYSERSKVIEARDAGVTEFVCKPISARALFERIANTCVNPRPFIRAKNFFGPDRRRFDNPKMANRARRSGDPDPVEEALKNSGDVMDDNLAAAADATPFDESILDDDTALDEKAAVA